MRVMISYWGLSPPFQVGFGEESGVEARFFRAVAALLLEVLKTSILLETISSLSSNDFFFSTKHRFISQQLNGM